MMPSLSRRKRGKFFANQPTAETSKGKPGENIDHVVLVGEQWRGTNQDEPDKDNEFPAAPQMLRVGSDQKNEKSGVERRTKIVGGIEGAEAVE